MQEAVLSWRYDTELGTVNSLHRRNTVIIMKGLDSFFYFKYKWTTIYFSVGNTMFIIFCFTISAFSCLFLAKPHLCLFILLMF